LKSPIALQVLAQLFEKHNVLGNLPAFISKNAQQIYNITPSVKEVVLEKKPFTVPAHYNNVVPMYAGKTINYNIKEVKNG